MAQETHPYGVWHSWRPHEAARFFAPLPAPWWIAGGWAIDLFLGHQTRPHDDLDVQVLRQNQQEIRTLFRGWDVQAAHPSPPESPPEWPFRDWEIGEDLSPDVHDIWCRPSTTEPWAIQLMIADVHEDRWLFRRDPGIARPISTIGRVTRGGIPYLSPEIQLLYKAKGMRPKDGDDFQRVLPQLGRTGRQWLWRTLTKAHPGHPWLAQLKDE
jgi:hypothetical protein